MNQCRTVSSLGVWSSNICMIIITLRFLSIKSGHRASTYWSCPHPDCLSALPIWSRFSFVFFCLSHVTLLSDFVFTPVRYAACVHPRVAPLSGSYFLRLERRNNPTLSAHTWKWIENGFPADILTAAKICLHGWASRIANIRFVRFIWFATKKLSKITQGQGRKLLKIM